jgi:hypothetical protein
MATMPRITLKARSNQVASSFETTGSDRFHANPPPPAVYTTKNEQRRADGREFVQWSRQRFVKECGGHKEERRANLMYDAMREEIKQANKRKLEPAASAGSSSGRRSLFDVTPPRVDRRQQERKDAAKQREAAVRDMRMRMQPHQDHILGVVCHITVAGGGRRTGRLSDQKLPCNLRW